MVSEQPITAQWTTPAANDLNLGPNQTTRYWFIYPIQWQSAYSRVVSVHNSNGLLIAYATGNSIHGITGNTKIDGYIDLINIHESQTTTYANLSVIGVGII